MDGIPLEYLQKEEICIRPKLIEEPKFDWNLIEEPKFDWNLIDFDLEVSITIACLNSRHFL
jgi:hypothetical protein